MFLPLATHFEGMSLLPFKNSKNSCQSTTHFITVVSIRHSADWPGLPSERYWPRYDSHLKPGAHLSFFRAFLPRFCSIRRSPSELINPHSARSNREEQILTPSWILSIAQKRRQISTRIFSTLSSVNLTCSEKFQNETSTNIREMAFWWGHARRFQASKQ